MIIGLNNSSSYLEIELDHTIYFSPFQKRKENDSFSLFYNYIIHLKNMFSKTI